jgi:hypothetical protein
VVVLSVLVLGFEVLTAVVINDPIFLNIGPCSTYVNRLCRGTYQLYFQGRKSAEQEISDGAMSRRWQHT